MNDSCRISFDESGDDEEEQSDDHDPRRSKRARQGEMWTRRTGHNAAKFGLN